MDDLLMFAERDRNDPPPLPLKKKLSSVESPYGHLKQATSKPAQQPTNSFLNLDSSTNSVSTNPFRNTNKPDSNFVKDSKKAATNLSDSGYETHFEIIWPSGVSTPPSRGSSNSSEDEYFDESRKGKVIYDVVECLIDLSDNKALLPGSHKLPVRPVPIRPVPIRPAPFNSVPDRVTLLRSLESMHRICQL